MNDITKNKKNNNTLKKGSKNLNNENWKVYHPNGRHMFTCGERKAFWYIERKLATIIGKKKIKFTFMPKGNGFENNEVFGLYERENICVVSGVEHELQRHHIVPYCYRTYFPDEYKSKNHHDVVLINYELHCDYEVYANKYKNEIANMFNVKTINELNIEYTTQLREIGKNNSIVINAIHAILKKNKNIPNQIKLDKLQLISKGTNIDYKTICNFTYIQLYKLYLMLKEEHKIEIENFKQNNRYKFDHGYHVVQKLKTEKDIMEFVKLWRHHFIETMKPKYMPKGWSIDFRVKTKL